MFTELGYVLGWLVYLSAALGCCMVWWRITRHVGWYELRQVLRLVCFTVLFTPWFSDPDREPEVFRDQVETRITLGAVAGEAQTVQEEVDEGLPPMAPAYVVAAFDYLSGGMEAARRGLRPIVILSIAGFVLLLPAFLVRRLHGPVPEPGHG